MTATSIAAHYIYAIGPKESFPNDPVCRPLRRQAPKVPIPLPQAKGTHPGMARPRDQQHLMHLHPHLKSHRLPPTISKGTDSPARTRGHLHTVTHHHPNYTSYFYQY